MTLYVAKMSLPGWCNEVGSELEAKEIIYSRICKHCLLVMRYEEQNGYGYDLEDTDGKDLDELTPVQIHETTLQELLFTPCGLEYDFFEDGEDDYGVSGSLG